MGKAKVVIFGAGNVGHLALEEVAGQCEVACFSDNNPDLWGKTIEGKPVVEPAELPSLEFDRVLICRWKDDIFWNSAIKEQLLGLGIPEGKIDDGFVTYYSRSRRIWLHDFSRQIYAANIDGAVAEVGVAQGDFARVINACFPDRHCYLFDTFSGFTKEDIRLEKLPSKVNANFNANSAELVMERMPHPENCVVKKGRFPETAVDVEGTFCFVHLDADLYQPIAEGLRFFYHRLEKGGVIAVHDYYSHGFPNAKTAVDEFAMESKIPMFPLGDGLSVFLFK